MAKKDAAVKAVKVATKNAGELVHQAIPHKSDVENITKGELIAAFKLLEVETDPKA